MGSKSPELDHADVHGAVNGVFRFAKAWLLFCLFLSLALLGGTVYAVYLLFRHFGVIG